MNPNENTVSMEQQSQAEVSEVPIEKSKLVKLWARLKQAMSVSGETLESWERIEAKRHHARFEQNQWRNF